MENRVRLECLAVAANVGMARLVVAALAAQAPFALSDVEEIKVAVSEAVSNAVVHGYRESGGGMVVVDAALADDVLTITVSDAGVGMEDVAAARAAAQADPNRMGLGFVFMETFMDRLEVETAPRQGTRVRMVRRAAPVPAGSRDVG